MTKPGTKEERREKVFNTISDGVSNFLYYDRKEDEELPRGAIEDMITKGEITLNEMVDKFANELRIGLGLVKRPS